MRPGARLAAAIEVLEETARAQVAADRVLDAYFRARRYAGKQDRAAISAIVWTALREGRALDWRLGEGAPPLRLKAFAALRRAEGLTVEEVAARCTGEGYDPAPLAPAEQAALAGMDRDEAAPDWVRLCYPPELDAALRARFGGRFEAAMQALADRAPLDLRVNTLKAGREEVLAALAAAGIGAEAARLSPVGIRVPGRDWLGRHAVFRSGAAAVQDEGSQVVALMCEAAPGEAVADYCAGAGGKTLALAAAMRARGRLLALDVEPVRLARMAPRLERAGIERFVERRPAASAGPAGGFDRVLVDAPCSLTGTWRRHPQARWSLGQGEVARLAALQGGILDRAAALVRPGGRLVYATCSLLEAEDEGVVEAFLERHPGFRPLDHGAVFTRVTGVPAPAGVSPSGLSLDPLGDGTDGFFVACLGRDDPEPSS